MPWRAQAGAQQGHSGLPGQSSWMPAGGLSGPGPGQDFACGLPRRARRSAVPRASAPLSGRNAWSTISARDVAAPRAGPAIGQQGECRAVPAPPDTATASRGAGSNGPIAAYRPRRKGVARRRLPAHAASAGAGRAAPGGQPLVPAPPTRRPFAWWPWVASGKSCSRPVERSDRRRWFWPHLAQRPCPASAGCRKAFAPWGEALVARGRRRSRPGRYWFCRARYVSPSQLLLRCWPADGRHAG